MGFKMKKIKEILTYYKKFNKMKLKLNNCFKLKEIK